MLEVPSSGDDRNVLHDHLVHLRHQDARAVLDPSLLGVSDDENFGNLQEVLEQNHNLFLHRIKLLPMNPHQILHVLLIFGVEKGCWQESIIVIQYDYVLVSTWLLNRCQPHAVVHQLRQVLVTNLLSGLLLEDVLD